ncbi:MAG: GNAT family N-acetyltransferase [Flavobacteriales bacterium]|nr:GNAT family N-acetyltransferase [Flavobacteriales bacterium]
MISYGYANSEQDLIEILILQKKNLQSALSTIESDIEGFVTVDHDLDLLKRLNHPYPHIISRAEGKIIAYALVMETRWKNEIEVLKPMFKEFEKLTYKGQGISTFNYFVMGQICVDKSYRGKGIFRGLYQKMASSMKKDHGLILTEVSQKNQRSLNAHLNVGFTTLKEYFSQDGHHWHILALDISNA